jgi:hypothetical protein
LDGGSSTAQLTFDGSNNLSAMSFSAPQSSAAYSGVDCSSGVVCTGETATSAGVAADARAFGWNYQSFGVWLNETSPTTFQAGAMSAGAVTPGSAVPLAGNPTFLGLTSGFYVDTAGVPYFTSASLSANVNFGTQSILFSTTNTTIGNLSTGTAPISASGLNMTGTLTYAPGSSQFTGPVTAPGVSLSGTATGRFYGPAAEEIGGVYRLTGTAPSSMIGAFGGRR